jgi:Protein of unknown function (DUF3072)
VNKNPEKDPSEWTTGDEPMTGPQASYLKTLCQEARADFDETLTKAQASQRIEELQKITGRGSASRRRRVSEPNREAEKSAPEKGVDK